MHQIEHGLSRSFSSNGFVIKLGTGDFVIHNPLLQRPETALQHHELKHLWRNRVFRQIPCAQVNKTELPQINLQPEFSGESR